MAQSPDSHDGNPDEDNNLPIRNGHLPYKKDDVCDIEKCIGAENRGSIIIYPNKTKETRKGWKKYFGACCAILAGVLSSVNFLLVKTLNQKYQIHPLTVSFWRCVGSLPITTFILVFSLSWSGKKVLFNICPIWDRRTWVLHIFITLNGILSWAYVVLRYWSLKYLTMSDAAVIVYSSPIVVVILAHFFLKEKCGIISILNAFIALGGVILISRPPFITGQAEFQQGILIGLGLALSAMISNSIIAIAIRKIREVHFSFVLFVHSCYISLLSTSAASILGVLQVPKDTDEWIIAVLTMISGFLVQLTQTLAYKYEEAGRVVLIMCLEIVLSYVWQYIFLDTNPDLYSLLGSGILIFTVIITLVRKWVGGLKEDSSIRKLCCFLLK